MKEKEKKALEKNLHDRFECIRKDTDELREAIGYKHPLTSYSILEKPDLTVAEKIDAICKHLGIAIVRTVPEVKIKKIKSSRAKKE